MQILHTGRGLPLEEVRRGAAFRFLHQGKSLVGLKVFLKDTEAGLVLTEGSTDLPPASVFSPEQMDARTVLELVDVALVPSTDEKAVILQPGQFAEPGELELVDGRVLMCISTPFGNNRRVDVATGEVLPSGTSQPIIITKWSLVQQVMGQPVTIYTRKAPLAGKVA